MKNLKNNQSSKREDHEPPPALKKGMSYHHTGIPTNEQKPDEKYIEQYKMYVSGFDTSEYGIEWMRFEKDSPVSELVKTVPHVAFEVENLEEVIKGKKLLGEINSPSEGVRVAMIIENGAPVEFIEFTKNERFVD